MFQAIIGSWPAPLPEVLTPKPGIVKSVLDLGCGSGAWSVPDVPKSLKYLNFILLSRTGSETWRELFRIAQPLALTLFLFRCKHGCHMPYAALIQSHRPMPTNFRSEVDDINLGLEHFRECFDVVHARFICSGVRSSQFLFRPLFKNLFR